MAFLDPIKRDQESGAQGALQKAVIKLPIHIAPVMVVGLGALFIIASLFMPHLSSTQVMNIVGNTGFESDPAIVLGAIGGGLAAIRYYKTGSSRAASSAIFVGLWFTAWSIYGGYTSQLSRIGCTSGPSVCELQTSPGVGLYAAGIGAAIIALGGLMMRFPNNSFGLASGSVTTEDEQAGQIAATKVCPQCAETIKAAAKVCRFCQTRFDTSGLENHSLT